MRAMSDSVKPATAMFLTSDPNNATLTTPVFESTPLIFFPPELAYQISVTTYIHIGCLAVS